MALLTDGNFSKVPILVGSNSGEGILNAGDYINKCEKLFINSRQLLYSVVTRPELLGSEFSDVTVWDEIRGKIVLVVSVSSVSAGPVYIFDRETRRNGSDIGPCDVQISRSPGGGRKFSKQSDPISSGWRESSILARRLLRTTLSSSSTSTLTSSSGER